ncbi:MAG TPA: molybdopterin-binding protein [Thermoplasmata archaeon]|nr:molybdopterin-binding protein [Thermoplasmata archaeon]
MTAPSANPPYPLLRLAQVRAEVASLPLRPVPITWTDSAGSAGLWSAREVRSPRDVPPRPASAMDGYALGIGGGAFLREFRLVAPGRTGRLRPGEAMTIVTGAPLPAGAAAVARAESVHREGNIVRLRTPARPGVDVHARGSSLRRGTRILARGSEILPYSVAGLLAAGVARVPVRRPRAIVLATGSELTRPDRGEAGRFDALGPALVALMRRWCDVEYAGVVPDDRATIRSAIETAAGASDLVVTLGGSSVGPRDQTKAAVAEAGRLVVGGTRVNVLKRAGFGMVHQTPVLVLPGQVESAFVSFHEHGLAILERLVGAPLRSFVRRPLGAAITVAHRMDSTYLFREEDGRAVPVGWGVARYESLLHATGFAYLRHGRTYPAGHLVTMQRLEHSVARPDEASGRIGPDPGRRTRAGGSTSRRSGRAAVRAAYRASSPERPRDTPAESF